MNWQNFFKMFGACVGLGLLCVYIYGLSTLCAEVESKYGGKAAFPIGLIGVAIPLSILAGLT